MMAFMRVIATVLALVSCTAWSSHPFESARDQYEAREDRPQPLLLDEATDHRPEVHRFAFIKKSTDSSKKSVIPDLQVGCGDGFIHEKFHEHSEVDKNKLIEIEKVLKRRALRRKRSYTPWSGEESYIVPYQSITVWKPPVYQLSRPYYIPIFGAAGRRPIYFPPQPLLLNPGVPKDNKKPYQGPSYLPPAEPTTSMPETTMTISNRFDGGDNNDDRPIWDIAESVVPTTTAIIPTRKTKRPGNSVTHPPLIHNPTNGETASNPQDNVVEAAPPPPAAQSVRPARPPSGPSTEPSRCVWAIISCCSSSGQVSYDCFEQLGCPGVVWDGNPCDSEYAKAAISAALNYYEDK